MKWNHAWLVRKEARQRSSVCVCGGGSKEKAKPGTWGAPSFLAPTQHEERLVLLPWRTEALGWERLAFEHGSAVKGPNLQTEQDEGHSGLNG